MRKFLSFSDLTKRKTIIFTDLHIINILKSIKYYVS